jgi:regulator of protease activity HflC (stomatin/prohibitin superfamily)
MDIMTLLILAVILEVIIAILIMAIRIVNQWEQAVILFLGKFIGIKGPG